MKPQVNSRSAWLHWTAALLCLAVFVIEWRGAALPVFFSLPGVLLVLLLVVQRHVEARSVAAPVQPGMPLPLDDDAPDALPPTLTALIDADPGRELRLRDQQPPLPALPKAQQRETKSRASLHAWLDELSHPNNTRAAIARIRA